MKVRFGTAGKSDSFEKLGYKGTTDIADYIMHFNLNAFEYQCGRGVRINEESVKKLGEDALKNDIALSLHSPYYISLSSVEEEKRNNSINYIVDSAKASRLMGADRIVVHSGSCGKLSREEALSLAKDTLKKALNTLDELSLSDISICPETMGKINQLGTLEEVIELCKTDERLIPCIDFGHLYARTFGGINGEKDYKEIFDKIENGLGYERLKNFHSHFSKIEYTEKGGEKCHLTFDNTLYGPQFEPLMELVLKRGLTPRFICESAGTQAEDASAMKKYYESIGG